MKDFVNNVMRDMSAALGNLDDRMDEQIAIDMDCKAEIGRIRKAVDEFGFWVYENYPDVYEMYVNEKLKEGKE